MATPTDSRQTHRRSKRCLLAEEFRRRLHEPIGSAELHSKFGSAARTRISELNRLPDGDLTIRNFTYSTPTGQEISLYTATPRRSAPVSITPARQDSLFDMTQGHRDE